MTRLLTRLTAFFAPILLALLLALLVTPMPQPDESLVEPPLTLRALDVDSAAELEARFAELDYNWPLTPGEAVPALSVVRFPADLARLSDVKRKKSLFFRALLPLVLAENKGILEARQMVIDIFAKPPRSWTPHERDWLASIAGLYRVFGDLGDTRVQQKLLRRVDIVPPALALAQAANESAWGSSRFAQLANNLFGQWTYKESEGIVPLNRPEGAKYAVRKFESLDASVRAYLLNLNTNAAYRELRLKREQMRRAGVPLDGAEMASGLRHYSARGEEYIAEIQAMIRVNRLAPFMQDLELRPGEPQAVVEELPAKAASQSGPTLAARLLAYFLNQG